jgi:hypothetical protein
MVSNVGGRETIVYLMAVQAVRSAIVVHFGATAIGAVTRAKTERFRDVESWKFSS